MRQIPIRQLTASAAIMAGYMISTASAAILTPEADADYKARLLRQPAIAEAIAIPQGLSTEEEEALRFIYAYIATPDALDYDSDFFLKNIRSSLKARKEMPWGKTVPDREWRHFVLPVRINNENLDLSRTAFFEELKERVKGMTMEEAILEVNHWCHEKVSYQPSDARTSSPLATVCNALGRCGEESTFTVAALRSIGIPARQVYTPRWAHTDDNHAWVEAWADGKWHFLGACEPEAVLDLGWFNSAAARGMLMNTKVTGHYDGPEEKLETTPITTVINVTENYTPTAKTGVYVCNHDGSPAKDATVRFSLYNYAELYPLAKRKTDSDGYAELTSGLGDMVIWATDGKRFNLAPASGGKTITIRLDKDAGFEGSIDLDLTPPSSAATAIHVSDEATRINDLRKAEEDSIRLSYTATFFSPESADEFCRKHRIPDQAASLLVRSRGNRKVIETFLRETPPEKRQRALALLGAVAEKDLHDITPDVLADHLDFTRGNEQSALYIDYVLNPRIEYEMLRPYKEAILRSLSPAQTADYTTHPDKIAEDLSKGLITDSLYNPGGFRQSATSAIKHRTADELNRSLAFVAICRSLGIPARIDPVSHATQYADTSDKWHDVRFGEYPSGQNKEEAKVTLEIENCSKNLGREPKYYSQFTLSRIKDGEPELMEFDDFESLESVNSRRQPIQKGQYLLMTGQRLADGSVLARANFFKAENGYDPAELTIRQDPTALQVIGGFDSESLYTPVEFTPAGIKTDSPRSILSTTGRGYYALGIINPGHEPSAHALNDIASAADEILASGRKTILLFPDAASAERFRISDYGRLPENTVFGIDSEGTIAKKLAEGLELPENRIKEFPLFVVADTFNRIVFARQGYSINLGQTLAGILATDN